MKIKKISYYLLQILLAAGATLIISFLSFGGMYALLPILPLALIALTISIAYEGEIYWQNIHNALNKLFLKREYIKHHLANDYLLKHFPDTQDNHCPQFFKDYENQLQLLAEFEHKSLSKADKKRKKKVKKTLKAMEKWFAKQLFAEDEVNDKLSGYEQELRVWLKEHGQQDTLALFQTRRKLFLIVGGFSTVTAIFMGMGSTYLLVGELAAIPVLASLPFGMLPALVIPMAIIAGIAYGLMTYNAITDMINNDTIRQWYFKIRDDIQQGRILRNIVMITTVTLLVALAVALTICTAGTWWTIAKTAQPLFGWMTHIPGFIMGIINPIITGISAFVFNLQNTADSLDVVYEVMDSKKNAVSHAEHGQENIFSRFKNRFSKVFNAWRSQENWLQMINPFRLCLKLIMTPLRIILFILHLFCVGVEADRIPGVPKILSAFLGIISEGFVDLHYFVPHNHENHDHHHDTHHLLEARFSSNHEHDHSNDLPTRILKALFSPLYFLAAAWDCLASHADNNLVKPGIKLSWSEAWNKQWGEKPIQRQPMHEVEENLSQDWQAQHAVYKIERYKEKHFKSIFANRTLAEEKVTELNKLQDALRHPEEGSNSLEIIQEEANKPIYGEQRFFGKGKTKTQDFLEQLPKVVNYSTGN